MDGRVSLIPGLALVLGLSGCTPGIRTSSSSRAETPPVAQAAPSKNSKTKIRQPKADTCISFGDFRLRQAGEAGKTEADRRQYLAEARKAYLQALEIEPRSLTAQIGLARVTLGEGDHARAVAAYKATLKLYPKEALVWFELGMAHSRAKAWKPAVQALSRAADLDPKNRQYGDMLGYCLARAGAYDQSLTVFSRYVSEDQAHYNVARMMYQMKQDDLARQHLRLALTRNPKLKQAAELLVQIETGVPGKGGAVVPVRHEEPAP
jgi:tetratricopeptide (TPR) repeat protein